MNRVLLHLNEHLLVWVTICFVVGGAIAALVPADLAPWVHLARFLPLLSLCVVMAFLLPPGPRPLVALPFFAAVGLLHVHTALQPPVLGLRCQ